MSTMREFDKLVKQRAELLAWWNLGQTECGYSDGCHKLRVDIPPLGMVAYCGQSHAGARNYHDAPKFFADQLRLSIAAQTARITEEAVKLELDRLNREIEQCREAVLATLAGS